MTDEVLVFEGREGGDWVRVWLEPDADGIAMKTHEIGSGIERNFGKEDLETILVVEFRYLPTLVEALQAGHQAEKVGPDTSVQASALHLLASRYAGNSAATSFLRIWLEELQIPSRFTVI